MRKISYPKIFPFLYLTSLFIISRVTFYILGVRFNDNPLTFYLQFIDIKLLKTHLLESIWYSHFQPPLYNFFLGIVMKLFPKDYYTAFYFISLITGFILMAGIYLLMRRLGVNEKINLILTTLFIISPSVIAYENILFYTLSLSALVATSALFFHRYMTNSRASDAFIFFFLIAVLSLTRSLYHILWVIMGLALLIIYKKHDTKKLLICASIPFLISAVIYVKDFILFGSTATSTWLGNELAVKTMEFMPKELRRKLILEKKISPLPVYFPYRSVETYQILLHLPSPNTSIAVLDQKRRSTGPSNLNNLLYITVSKQYLKDGLYALHHYPKYYLKSVKQSLFVYLLPGPAKDSGELHMEALKKLPPFYEKAYNTILLGQILPRTKKWTFYLNHPEYETRAALFWLIIFPFLLIYVPLLIFHLTRRKHQDKAFTASLSFMWITTIYISFLSVFIASRTNNRYRFSIEPLVLIFLGIFLTKILSVVKKRKQLR